MAESLKAMTDNSTAKNESIQKLAEQQHKKSIQDQKKSIQDTIANASKQIKDIRPKIRQKKAEFKNMVDTVDPDDSDAPVPDRLSQDSEYKELRR